MAGAEQVDDERDGLPFTGLSVAATVLATRMATRSGLRPVLVIGSVGLLAGSLSLLTVGALTPVVLLLVVVVVVIAAVFGVPNGFNDLANQLAMHDSARRDQLSTASGLYRIAQYVGAILASVLVGLSFGAHTTDEGLHLLAAITALVSAELLLTAAISNHLKPRREIMRTPCH